MDLELIKKLYNFHLHANLHFAFDGIKNHEKYTLVYHNKIKDFYFNFITEIKANTKEEFDQIMQEANCPFEVKLEPTTNMKLSESRKGL